MSGLEVEKGTIDGLESSYQKKGEYTASLFWKVGVWHYVDEF